jgi:hypothetical protein
MIIVLILSISIHIIAKGLHPERISNCHMVFQDSTSANMRDRYELNDTDYNKNHSNLINLFSIHSADHGNTSLPDNEINEYSSDWKLKKSADDIHIYYQWIMSDSNKKTRRLLGEMTVDAPVSSIVALIKNETKAGCWIYCVKNFYNIDIVEDKCWYSYVEFGFSWPLPNYDLILHNCLIYDLQKRITTIESNSVPDFIPEKSGIKRFQHFRGTWKLVSLPDGRTNIKYIIFTDMNSKIPVWVTDPIVLKGLMQTMKGMRDYVSNSDSESDEFNSISKK